MLAPIPLLLAGLALVIAAFAYAWWQSVRVGRHPHRAPTPTQLGLGAVTLFFDTLVVVLYAGLSLLRTAMASRVPRPVEATAA